MDHNDYAMLRHYFFSAADQLLIDELEFPRSFLINSRLSILVRKDSSFLSKVCHLIKHDAALALHSLRVGFYAAALGMKHGLSNDCVYPLFVGSVLHDYGKMQIDPDLLNKAGKLNPDEWAVIKQHPAAGTFMNMNDSSDILILYPILQHHERLDGSGYLGLQGESIHLFGRIAAVADVFDAMTEDRSYRKGHPPHAALQHLRDNGGTLYDRTFVALLSELLHPKTAGVSFAS